MLVTLLTIMNPYIYGVDIVMPEIKSSESNVVILGTLLYTKYLFAFEVAGITTLSYSGLFWVDGITCILATLVLINVLNPKTTKPLDEIKAKKS